MDWIEHHWPEVAGTALLAVGVWWLMPPATGRPKPIGLLLALAGALLVAFGLHAAAGPLDETVLFSCFALAAIMCSVLTVTNHKPVYSALWFALATLSVCGLFLLQQAPFLAAATVIVYAGAIVVTFVFVIMLAQQAGATGYDQRSRQPFTATVAAAILLAALLGTLSDFEGIADAEATITPSAAKVVRGSPDPAQDGALSAGSGDPRTTTTANPLSRPSADAKLGTMHGLGRSLFGDYLFAVELAGTLLLVATIGAIAIAPRRRGGSL